MSDDPRQANKPFDEEPVFADDEPGVDEDEDEAVEDDDAIE